MNNLINIGLSPINAESIPIHSHGYWEIIYFCSGVGKLWTEDREMSFKPGFIVCMPPQMHHQEISSDGFQSIYLIVEDVKFTSLSPIVFTDNEDKDFCTILMLMYKEFHLNHLAQTYRVEKFLNILSSYIVCWNNEPSVNPFVEQFKKAVITNIGNCSFSVHDAIKSQPISPDYFRKLFKKETGQSLNNYLIEKRIEHAKNLLSFHYYNAVTVKCIAIQVGYIDQYYFSKVFKKFTGVSPKKWSEKNHQLNN
jgi:YesN/AraC family two-component response regulator